MKEFSAGKDKPVDRTKLSAAELGRIAEQEQRVPGTDNYHPLPGASTRVGRAAIEGGSIVGHDNLEATTEIEKGAEEQGRSADGTFR